MTHGAPTSPDDDRSPAALWDAARYALSWLVNLFGSPAELAGFGVLAPRERTDLLSWLRPLEALVRALLVIEAAALPPAAKPARTRRTHTRRSRRVIEHHPDAPESWRVHFRVLPARPGPASGRHDPKTELPSAWPVAERLEAVLRVLDNPEPFARRLASRLRGRCDQTMRCLRPPPESRTTRPGDWAFKEARSQALVAATAFDTS